MGAVSSRLPALPGFRKEEPRKILFFGLDASGKTTILYKMKLGDVVTTIPTIGFNVETFHASGMEVTGWDVGGRDKMRPLYRHYFTGISAAIYGIDSNDRDRLEHSIDVIVDFMNDTGLEAVPWLVLCNKQDLPKAMPVSEIEERVHAAVRERVPSQRCVSLRVLGTCATSGQGLDEAFSTLADMIRAPRQAPRPELVRTRAPEYVAAESALALAATDPGNASLVRFAPVRQRSECIFARLAVLWGGAASAAGASLEDQARANAAPLAAFTRRSEAGEKLDGYVLEVDATVARGGDVVMFGECVRALLTALSDLDPEKAFSMRRDTVGKPGWRWCYGGAGFFVTTFAPCYPPTHSRHTHGCDAAFVLLQPEASFLRHGLPADTPQMEWADPRTVRDRIRVAFRNAGRGYFIPPTLRYPMAEHIVKPLRDDGSSVLKWWVSAVEPQAGRG
eukprot:TRINITY_DN1413_c0_g1_i2.p1 TRINITY_DN1413_c0_g1~~TRINITY_DN1413_c0_g1_i2.p1  ORF type:complete len:449 (+),score=100.38 TRINITY_DN1413_c0_g1_i2:69-1415(+)